jgi:hypothetical protein
VIRVDRPDRPVEIDPMQGADGADRVTVRHSEHPDGPVLVYPAGAWAEFVAGAKNGEFDVDRLAPPGG